MADFEIRGADDVDALVRRMRTHADAKAIRKEMYQGLNRSTKGVRADMKDAIPKALPRGGGLAGEVQSSTRFNTSAKSGRNAGVTIWARNRRRDLRLLMGKRLRHPVFGNRRNWVTQTAGVNPDVFGKAFEDQKHDVARDITRVMENIARKVES
jgi:hypothetical protein